MLVDDSGQSSARRGGHWQADVRHPESHRLRGEDEASDKGPAAVRELPVRGDLISENRRRV